MEPLDCNTPSPTRYSCHECREDSELVLTNRATIAVRELYEHHLRQCRDCRRMHRTLYAIYEGPVTPTPLTGIRQEKEFHAVLRRMKEERPEPWYTRLSVRAGIGVLATSAAALTLALFDVAPIDFGLTPVATVPSGTVADGDGRDRTTRATASNGKARTGGIEHPAQSYGRVVGGNAAVLPPGQDVSSTADTFPVGTRFQLSLDDSLQVGLVGKIVANFTPGTDVEWTVASPALMELELHRGIAAFRYDRKPSDPILQVRTPSALVRVVGTVFTVQVDSDDQTTVSVLRGQVEVLDPSTNRLMAEVESGYRLDVASGTFDDVGKIEVQAALPLSNEVDQSEDLVEWLAVGDGRIPGNWNIPGLPDDPALRTLANVPARPGSPTWYVPSIRVTGTTGAPEEEEPAVPATTRRAVENEGNDLIQDLLREAEATRRKELLASLERCRALYDSHETRYRAARCLASFIDKYGNDPLAAEGYLLVGILRMDYALDYRAAEAAFQTFLRRAPNHQYAEMALYRMWLSSTEDGRISEALQRGRSYLRRYPHGRYVGKIIQRFPELKADL